jgi:hypothetical protein
VIERRLPARTGVGIVLAPGGSMSVVRAAALLAVLLAGCRGGPAPTQTGFRDCGVPGPDPVFNAWRQACSRGDPSAAGPPWATLPPGYSAFPASTP